MVHKMDAAKPGIGMTVAAPGRVPARRLHLSEVDEHHRSKSPSRKPGYCVDELCTCGQHRCIPQKAPIPFEGNSTYRQEYGPKPLPKQYVSLCL